MQALILRPAALFFCVILRPATCDLALYIYNPATCDLGGRPPPGRKEKGAAAPRVSSCSPGAYAPGPGIGRGLQPVAGAVLVPCGLVLPGGPRRLSGSQIQDPWGGCGGLLILLLLVGVW